MLVIPVDRPQTRVCLERKHRGQIRSRRMARGAMPKKRCRSIDMENRKASRKTVQSLTLKQRVGALVCSGMLATSAALTPTMALAADINASVSGNASINKTNNGTGSTDVTIQLKSGDKEVSGSNDPDNLDNDNPKDGIGDNVAFTVPTSINFVSDARGVLTGPTAEATFIENESSFDIHTSSAQVISESGWSLVADAENAAQTNALDFQIGPTGDLLDAYEYRIKAGVGDKSKWHMDSKTDAGIGDRVLLNTKGNINNVDKDLKSRTKVATITWYVTPGSGASV